MEKQSSVEQQAISQNFPSQSEDTICLNYADTAINKLDIELVRNMISGYKQNHLKMINEGVVNERNMFEMSNNVEAKDKKFDDAHSIWFDLETLKQFIYHIENETKKYSKELNMEISSKDLGIRIHYAKYPNACDWATHRDLDDVPENYKNRHTLLMIPTIREEDTHRNFDVANPDTYKEIRKGKIKYTKFGKNIHLMPLFQTPPDEGSPEDEKKRASRNHGSLIPPGKEDGSGS